MPGMFSQPRGDTPGLLDLLRLCIGGGLRWNSTGGFLRRLRGGEKRLGEPWWDWNHWEMRLFNIKWWLFLLGYHIILNICLKTNLNTALYWFQHISTEIQLLCLMVSFFLIVVPHTYSEWGIGGYLLLFLLLLFFLLLLACRWYGLWKLMWIGASLERWNVRRIVYQTNSDGWWSDGTYPSMGTSYGQSIAHGV